MKRVLSCILLVSTLFSMVGCSSSGDKLGEIKDKAAHTVGDVTDAAISGYHTASDFMEQQTERATRAISGLSFPDFQNGFETAVRFFGTTIASSGGKSQNFIAKGGWQLFSKGRFGEKSQAYAALE